LIDAQGLPDTMTGRKTERVNLDEIARIACLKKTQSEGRAVANQATGWALSNCGRLQNIWVQ